MSKKHIVTYIMICLIAAGGSFYAGTKFVSADQTAGRQNFGNFTPNRQKLAEGQAGGNLANRLNGSSAGFLSGEIISQDETSLTIKLPDDGSKIIFYGPATHFSQAVTSTAVALAVGENISVVGTVNDDGSVTAQSVEQRPAVISR